MLRLFCLITGDNYQAIKIDTLASKRKVSVLASMVLIPVSIWFFIGFSLAHSMFELEMRGSLAVGLFVAAVIFVIERGIIIVNSGWGISIFRCVLGLLIAFIGAIFLDEMMFKADIDREFHTYKQKLIASQKEAIKGENAKGLEDARNETEVAYRAWMEALDEARRESDGSGGSGVRGISEITKLKIAFSERLERDYQEAKARYDERRITLEDKFREAEKQIDENVSEKSILLRIKLLFGLVISDSFVRLFYCAVTLFLVALEFIVIIVKNAMKETSYEYRMRMQEVIARSRLDRFTKDDPILLNPYDNAPPVKKARQMIVQIQPGLF